MSKGDAVSRAEESNQAVTCASCLAQNEAGESFCRECGAPVGPMTNLDPFQAIQTQGFLFRKSLEGRPKLIVLIGVWILHLPVLVVGLGVAIRLFLNLRSRVEWVFIFAMCGLAYYAFVVLYRITRNYFTLDKKR